MVEELRLLVSADARMRVAAAVEDPWELLNLVGNPEVDVCVLHTGGRGKLTVGDLMAVIRAVVVGRQTPVLLVDDDCAPSLLVLALEAGVTASLGRATRLMWSARSCSLLGRWRAGLPPAAPWRTTRSSPQSGVVAPAPE